jgi:hypothetical protein
VLSLAIVSARDEAIRGADCPTPVFPTLNFHQGNGLPIRGLWELSLMITAAGGMSQRWGYGCCVA